MSRRSRPSRRPPALAVALAAATALAVAAALLIPPPAHAAGVYYTRDAVLRSFFADCDRVGYLEVTPDLHQQRRLERVLGYPVRGRHIIYYGERRGERRGYAIIDDTPGQHKDITFAVLVDPTGVISRVEVMVYREPKGDGVRRASFRDQFVGKTRAAPLRLGKDIAAVSGATISSRSMTDGVRRALLIIDELVLRPEASKTAGLP